MNIEDSIALNTGCSLHQRIVIDSLPVLDVDNLSAYLTPGGTHAEVEDAHKEIAQSILDNRYTYLGAKDYIYCYLYENADDPSISMDTIIDHIIQYAHSLRLSHRGLISQTISLLYSANIITCTGTGRNIGQAWKYYTGGMWYGIDRTQVCRMIMDRFRISDICNRFGIPEDSAEYTLRSVTKFLGSGDVSNELYYHKFIEACDNKQKVFVTRNGCCYDIQYGTIRKGLPSDLSTLKSNANIDVNAWTRDRLEMLEVLKSWLSFTDVVDNYLDVLGAAISEFQPRYAIVNSGSGSDGKSTFFQVLKYVYGTYCGVCPSKGPSIDVKSSNDATPLANMLVGKRICLTGDAKDVVKLIQSPGFKSVSGGDSTYIRQLHREASTESPKLKMLILINTNQDKMPLTEVSEMTRLKVFKWLNKTVDSGDLDIIPKHRLLMCKEGIFEYEKFFLSKYADCLLTELILRNKNIKFNMYNVMVCKTVKEWTVDAMRPMTIASFLRTCTENMSTDNNVQIYEGNDQMKVALMYQTSLEDTNSDVATIENLFLTYIMWRKSGARFTKTDPTDIDTFTSHLAHFYPISKRKNAVGIDEQYIEGIKIKSEGEMMNIIHPNRSRMLTNNVNSVVNALLGSGGNFGTNSNKVPDVYMYDDN